MRPPRPHVPPMLDRFEQSIVSLAAPEPEPVEGECLVCFLVRATAAAGCGGGHAFVERYRSVRAPAATGVADRLRRRGAACDCSAVATAWELAREHRERDVHLDELVVPSPHPSCCGVGPSSAQPCALWVAATRVRRDAGIPTSCTDRPFCDRSHVERLEEPAKPRTGPRAGEEQT